MAASFFLEVFKNLQVPFDNFDLLDSDSIGLYNQFIQAYFLLYMA